MYLFLERLLPRLLLLNLLLIVMRLQGLLPPITGIDWAYQKDYINTRTDFKNVQCVLWRNIYHKY